MYYEYLLVVITEEMVLSVLSRGEKALEMDMMCWYAPELYCIGRGGV